MSYADIVKKYSAKFAECGFLDYVSGLAFLLDSELFAIPPVKEWEWKTKEHVEERKRVFTQFCAVCVRAGVEVPDVEPVFFDILLRDTSASSGYTDPEAEKETAMIKCVREQLQGNTSHDARDCELILSILELFPSRGVFRFSEEKFLAKLNIILINLGLSPIRPEYSEVNIVPPRIDAPAEEVKILIVDDDPGVALKTALALAGVQNILISFFHQKGTGSFEELEGQELQDLLTETARDVLSKRPDIVLMDRGLNDINGEDLIRKIKELFEESPIFVGNTDGDPEHLYEVGALRNFQKGKDPDGVNAAIRQLSR